MNYLQYRYIQDRAETLYKLHPEFFDDLSESQKSALQKGTLYHIDDETYPKSIKKYYKEQVYPDKELQREIMTEIKRIYKISGMGELNLEDEVKSSATKPR